MCDELDDFQIVWDCEDDDEYKRFIVKYLNWHLFINHYDTSNDFKLLIDQINELMT